MPGKKKAKKKESVSPVCSVGAVPEKRGKRHNSQTSDRRTGCSVLLECGCLVGEPVEDANAWECVRMMCTNANCDQPQLIHLTCYEHWEDLLVKMLSTTSWARSWTDSQRRANLWDKKGYLLIAKACKCLCTLGQVRRDLDYKPPTVAEPEVAGAPLAAVNNNNVAQEAAAVTASKAKRKKKQLPSLNQADWRPGFINKQLPNIGSGAPKSASSAVSKSVQNGTSQLQPAFFTDLDKPTEFELTHKRARTQSVDSAVSLKKEEDEKDKKRDSASPNQVLPPLKANAIDTVNDFVEAIRVLLRDRPNMTSLKVKDRRIQDIYRRCAPRLHNQINSVGGLTQALSLVCQTSVPAPGIELNRDADNDFSVSLVKPRPLSPSPNQPAVKSAVGQSVTAAYRTLNQTRSLPLDSEPFGQNRRRAKGKIQNVFDNFGYIETKALHTNVFFVPSHVDWASVQAVHGARGKQAPKQFPSLKEAFQQGDFVQFVALPQQERSGCEWMATKVTLLASEDDTGPPEPLRVNTTDTWSLSTQSPPLTPWEGDQSTPSTPSSPPMSAQPGTPVIGNKFETPPPTPSPRTEKLAGGAVRQSAIGQERHHSPVSAVYNGKSDAENDDVWNNEELALEENGFDCDWNAKADHPWSQFVEQQLQRPIHRRASYELFSSNTWQLGEQLCAGMAPLWNSAPHPDDLAEQLEQI